MLIWAEGGVWEDPRDGVVGQPALSLHEKDVTRPEEESAGHGGEAWATYQEDCRLAQAEGEERGWEVVFAVISVAWGEQETVRTSQ